MLINIISKGKFYGWKIKNKLTNIKKTQYGESWQNLNKDFYQDLYDRYILHHENFLTYIKSKQDAHTFLEIGCGTGIYPIGFKELFFEKKYVGIDISESAISYCKSHSNFEFIHGDFIKMETTKQFDLVFSHAVIDHVYDIESFLKKIISSTKKYAFISSYRGYFPNLEKHNCFWKNEDSCYYNDLSVKQIRDFLLKCNLNEDEFIIRSQETGMPKRIISDFEFKNNIARDLSTELVIEINKSKII